MRLNKVLYLFSSLYNRIFSVQQPEIDTSLNETSWPEQISRNEIVHFLERHSSNELKLVHKDLVDIDLSGLNLSGATFYRCSFKGANFSNCILRSAELQRSYFKEVDLSNSILIQADISDSYVRNCNLENSSLYRAIADRVDFRDSSLKNVNLYRASLSEVKRLTPLSLGHTIVQDSLEGYETYFRWLFGKEGTDSNIEIRIERVKKDRLIHGEYVYRLLKVVFANNGQYADSSWAYVEERKKRRQRHGLLLAKDNFAREYPKEGRFKHLRRIRFYLKHFGLWLLDWLAQLSCGYGERPLQTIVLAIITLIIFPLIYCKVGGISGPQSPLDFLAWFKTKP